MSHTTDRLNQTLAIGTQHPHSHPLPQIHPAGQRDILTLPCKGTMGQVRGRYTITRLLHLLHPRIDGQAEKITISALPDDPTKRRKSFYENHELWGYWCMEMGVRLRCVCAE